MIGITNTIISKYNLGYIQNGLISHYDGIYNLRTGHSSATTKWEDLTGSWDLQDAYGGGYTIQDNCYYFPSRGGLRFITAYNITPVTIEFAITTLDTSENYLISGWNSVYPNMGTRNGYLFIGSSSTFGCAVSLNEFHTVSIIGPDKRIIIDKQVPTIAATSVGNGWVSSTRAIGAYSSIDNYSWNGNIYAIRFYNRELTDEEIIHNQTLDIRRFNS